jgi:hypothetical protein
LLKLDRPRCQAEASTSLCGHIPTVAGTILPPIQFTLVKGEQFIGVDSGGFNYHGTAKEQEDGSIVLDVNLNVPPELETAQSRASQGLPHTRQFVATLPPAFGNGKPQEISSFDSGRQVIKTR